MYKLLLIITKGEKNQEQRRRNKRNNRTQLLKRDSIFTTIKSQNPKDLEITGNPRRSKLIKEESEEKWAKKDKDKDDT